MEDAQVLRDFLPEDLLQDLVDLLDQAEVRRNEFDLTRPESEIPEAVRRVASLAEERLGYHLNLAILKWYRRSDRYESEAYRFHQDPVRLQSIPLLLFTLTGEADLVFVGADGIERSTRTRANDLVLLDSRLLHRVTQPLNEDGERYYLFLGFDSERGSSEPYWHPRASDTT